jgi:hypothetical protein
MPDITVSAKEFIRYLRFRCKTEILPPLVYMEEALGHFGVDDILVTPDDLGQATLSTPGGRGAAPRPGGGPNSGETSPGRQDPGAETP